MKKIHIVECSVAVALVISVISSIFGFAAECSKIRDEVVRLHILANSDTQEDQNIKLKIRDVLLNSGEKLFSGETDRENAEKILNENRADIINVINKVLDENGFGYSADMYLTDEYFETREYDGFIMPAGRYKALKIILGEGKGHNWWCVMFPPLCLPAAKQKENMDMFFTQEGTELITNQDKYIMKIKIIEIIEGIKKEIADKMNKTERENRYNY